MARTFEQLAEVIYGKGQTQQPGPVEKPVETPAPAETAPPRTADVVRDLVGADDRLMAFLAADIQALEEAELADQRMIERNMAKD